MLQLSKQIKDKYILHEYEPLTNIHNMQVVAFGSTTFYFNATQLTAAILQKSDFLFHLQHAVAANILWCNIFITIGSNLFDSFLQLFFFFFN